MSTITEYLTRTGEPLVGLRMTAEAYFEAVNGKDNYELVDGVVVMTPSPNPQHQAVLMEIAFQLKGYLEDHPVGMVFPELDVHLGTGPTGGDLVYRPELVFVRKENLRNLKQRISGAPAVAVEVVSAGSRPFDLQTKKHDYEQHGIEEYWLIDPELETMTFWRLEAGRFVEATADKDRYASRAIEGFSLDLARIRTLFKL